MKTRFIGDIHGKWMSYLNIINNPHDPCSSSVQVGDFGLGFGERKEFVEYIKDEMNKPNTSHRFIRGNHDNLRECVRWADNYISDGTIEIVKPKIEPGVDIMYIGGALSIDRQYRTEGVDWWSDEELPYDDLFEMINIYEKHTPRIMVTHECPESIVPLLFDWYSKSVHPSRTRSALDSMLSIHKPDLWIFGHWHTDRDVTIDGTRFICLNELSYVDIDTENLSVGSIKPYGHA